MNRRRIRTTRPFVIMCVIAVAAIFIASSVQRKVLLKQLSEYEVQIQELKDEIAEEEARTKEIEEYAKYIQTDEYIEEVARDKLGLVMENEIVFKRDDD